MRAAEDTTVIDVAVSGKEEEEEASDNAAAVEVSEVIPSEGENSEKVYEDTPVPEFEELEE